MIIALYGVAFAMVAAGLTALVEGYGIIVVERGWTLVIAGTISASAGVLLFGVAYAASRIDRLVTETGRLRERLGRGEVAYPPPPPNLAAPASAPVPPGALDLPPAEIPTRPTLPPVIAALASGAAPAAADMAAVSTLRDGGSDRDEDVRREDIARSDFDRADLDAPDPGFDKEINAGRSVDIDDVDATLKEPSSGRTDYPLQDRSALSRDIAPTGLDDVPPSDDGLFADGEDLALNALPQARDEGFGSNEDAGRLDRDPDADEIAAPRELPAGADGDEPEAPQTVVGTYSSGGNNYVMYADGSIEADTPEGLFKFASLDELKEFIASGGEDRAIRP